MKKLKLKFQETYKWINNSATSCDFGCVVDVTQNTTPSDILFRFINNSVQILVHIIRILVSEFINELSKKLFLKNNLFYKNYVPVSYGWYH